MNRALRTFMIEGVRTTIPLHLLILENEDFRAARFSTQFLEALLPKLVQTA
jgi:acetyl-CoA carboxylase biotin carboxylase subunit